MTTLLKPTSETHILIVDDNPDNVRLLAKILESQSFIVRKSLSGRMALQGVYRDPPDLILLDINMPEMNGFEVCQQLKNSEKSASIPVIFISALERIEDKVQAFELGGGDYITKPFQEQEVLMRVKNQLLIQQQHQQLLEQNKRLEREIQERLKAEAEVRQLSLTDELTGLYNRRGFFVLAEQQMKIARRTKLYCCIVFTDLDGLKKINDTLGHEMGDRAIINAAQILKQTFRDADIIARLGGDEFALFISGADGTSQDFYRRLKANIDEFNHHQNQAYKLSMSIGVQTCDFNNNQFSLAEGLALADQLMYEHKKNKYSQVPTS
ncbi:diguanylate cyclase [Capilliphycus salinus ALCB114379]|uniref:GGDEF domain-containing response regulator n=1 Tax=Capilliphycus salinus TaxID=2768948 RepID=UPI0039A47CDC